MTEGSLPTSRWSGGLLHKVRRLREEDRPLRFLLSRSLWRTGWCTVLPLYAKTHTGVRVRFRPAAMAANLWVDSRRYDDDVAYLARMLKDGDVFVDVGANIGVHSLVAARLVGPSGLVIAIEPHPRTFDYLLENVRLNELSNVQAHRSAAGAKRTTKRLVEAGNDDEFHIGQDGHGLEVPVLPLDDIVPIGTRVALLKVDVEGYETQVLRGARAVLRQTEAIYIEARNDFQSRAGSSVDDVKVLLDEAGFDMASTPEGTVPRGHGDPSVNWLAYRTAR